MAETRIERDSMGEMTVPAAAYYGAQTARAVQNFPISGLRFSRSFIHALEIGSGTSTNMNANEVIANRALELLGEARGQRIRIHPNDHVNMGQSTNDVFPTAIHVAAYGEIVHALARGGRAGSR